MKTLRFFLMAAAALMASGPLAGIAGGLLGLPPGPAGLWLHSTVVALLLVAATWIALRLDGESLAALGLRPSPRRAAEIALGFLAGAVLFAAIALVQGFAVGASWQFSGASGFRAALAGLPIALVILFGEELVFRGYGFRRLVAAWGPRAALGASALAFGLYHLPHLPYLLAMGAMALLVAAWPAPAEARP